MTESTFDQPSTLMAETIKLTIADKRTLPQLYADTGIPFYWLRKFIQGEIQNPSVNRVQFLYEYLSGNKIVK